MNDELNDEIDWNEDVEVSGTGFRDYLTTDPAHFEATVEQLVRVSGQTGNIPSWDGKVTREFVGTFNGQPFTLYDYKRDNLIHIGGRRELAVARLKEMLVLLFQHEDELR